MCNYCVYNGGVALYLGVFIFHVLTNGPGRKGSSQKRIHVILHQHALQSYTKDKNEEMQNG